MARRVFFSFHYDDVFRANQVRNSWVTQGKEAAGFIDKAEFEKVEKRGQKAIENWINQQLNGTSVTVVLIGPETLNRYYVHYEICQSLNKGNSIIGVKIHNINSISKLCRSGNVNTIVAQINGRDFKFCDIADGIYNYVNDNGYLNMGKWIESSAMKNNK